MNPKHRNNKNDLNVRLRLCAFDAIAAAELRLLLAAPSIILFVSILKAGKSKSDVVSVTNATNLGLQRFGFFQLFVIFTLNPSRYSEPCNKKKKLLVGYINILIDR